jgi:L-threonylcarbamoyladenylate synthase
VRVPAHPLALRLLKACAIPIAAPSANPSGRLSPTRAEHVDLGDPQLAVLDGGPCAVGVESTVVRVIDAEAWLLRPGGLDRQKIQQIAGVLRQPSPEPGLDPSAPHSPGQLLAHYAPQRPVRLNATQVQANEALLAFGPQPLPGAGAVLNLSERGDTTEAAAHLFAYLRALDRQPFCAIAVMPIPQDGLGEAIADRLQRAAVGSNRAA